MNLHKRHLRQQDKDEDNHASRHTEQECVESGEAEPLEHQSVELQHISTACLVWMAFEIDSQS